MARFGCLATLFVLLYSSALLVSAQHCPLPNNTEIETAMRDLPTGGDGSRALDPTILEPVHYVCLAQGDMINTYQTLSVIATYTPSPGQSATTNIFQLICSNGVWTADTSGQPVTPDPSVRNITRYDCAQCRHTFGVDRCRACNDACNTGLMRCTSPFAEDCCLYFDRNGRCSNDNCTVSSGPNFIATASNNFTCMCNLTCPDGYTANKTSCNECIFTSICDRDSPCENEGTCIQYSPATNYTCDCTGTGYEGVNCTTELIPSPSPSIIAVTTSSSVTTPSPSPVCSVSNCADCDTSTCCKTCSAGFYLNPDDRCSCGPCRVTNCTRCRPLNSNCCALDSCEDGYVSYGSDNCQCGAPNSTTVEPPKPTAGPTDRTGFSSEGLAGLIVGIILGILLLLTLAAVIAYVIYYFVVGGGAGVTKAKSKSPFANGESHNNPLYLPPEEVANEVAGL